MGLNVINLLLIGALQRTISACGMILQIVNITGEVVECDDMFFLKNKAFCRIKPACACNNTAKTMTKHKVA